MALDYEAIRRDKEREYGTKVGNYGRLLAEDIYADRTHFIFELLQNAEDALRRRVKEGEGPLSVTFVLSETRLRFSHYGKPFDELDVRGICEFGESTKADDLTAIGRFGIGFKAVYAVTDRPEIHSGPEDFAVEKYVLPIAASPIDRNPDETVILLPFKSDDGTQHEEIAEALADMDISSLLFLREIDEIRWEVDGNSRGTITRESEILNESESVRRVRISVDTIDTVEWLVFSRPVTNNEGKVAGDVEIAFSLASDGSIEPTRYSPLSVFFPTSVSTGLRFLIQGPYRTTLARDNIPWNETWNKWLVNETALLLQDALRWMRDTGLLGIDALCCLPIAHNQYVEPYIANPQFAPIYDATKKALLSEPLLPRLGSGYVSAKQARLGSTRGVRELFAPDQLSELHGEEQELTWLDGSITPDQTRELWQYLTSHQGLGIQTVTPESIVSRLVSRLRWSKNFLESQPDEFIINLYAFFNGQRALWSDLTSVPLVRLEDNTHVQPRSSGQPQAFLSGNFATGFPTVKSAITNNEPAHQFLQQGLGLKEPDPVDDVIRHIIPTYLEDAIDVTGDDYKAHVERILNAFNTDSQTQRGRLLDALRDTPLLRTVDAGSGSGSWEKPNSVYLATQRLKGLFSGVEDVKIVDDSYDCLRGEAVRTLLEACGTVRHFRPLPHDRLSSMSREQLRSLSAEPKTSGRNDQVKNWKLVGLEDLLSTFPDLTYEQQVDKARWLWEELAHLEERRGRSVFEGEYSWSYYGNYSQSFDADFVKKLNETAWVPDESGDLVCPELVLFDSLDWRSHPFLESKIQFKRPVIDSLAQEAGLEPGAIDLMRKEGLTEANLRELLELRRQQEQDNELPESGDVGETNGDAMSVTTPSFRPEPFQAMGEYGNNSGSRTSSSTGAGTGGGSGSGNGSSGGSNASTGSGNGATRESGTWQFSPHVGVQSVGATDSDGSEYASRMDIEERAIQFILEHEPNWQRMPTNNPGYDLRQDRPDSSIFYCEVKGLSGTLHNHPAEMTPTEFSTAQEYGEAYWLYVVENVGTDNVRILKIQDPAGRAHRFSFNAGWENVADVVS